VTALKEQRKAQKQLRREAHIQHLERERRRRREAAAEFERAKRWAQKQRVKKEEASALFDGAGHEADDDSALRKPFSDTMASKLKYATQVEAAEEAHRRALQGQRLVSAVQVADMKAQRNPKTEFRWAKQHAVISRHLEAPAQLADKQTHATRHKDLKVTLANLIPAVEMSAEMSAGSDGNQKFAVAYPNVPRTASVYSEDESLEKPVWSRSIAHKQQASSIFSAIWHTLTGE
jgi:hypothetical protein